MKNINIAGTKRHAPTSASPAAGPPVAVVVTLAAPGAVVVVVVPPGATNEKTTPPIVAIPKVIPRPHIILPVERASFASGARSANRRK